jgi:hypothetical protein
MTGHGLEKTAKNDNHTAAVMIGEEGFSKPITEPLFNDNVFPNDGPPTSFVFTAAPAQLIRNVLEGSTAKPLIGAVH